MNRPLRTRHPSIPRTTSVSLLIHALLSVPLALALMGGWFALSHARGLAWLVIPIVAIVFLKPHLWLALVLALLPIIDRTPYTGNGYVTESDALIGAVLLALSLRRLSLQRELRDDMQPDWRTVPLLILMLLSVSYVLSLWRGITPFPPIDAGAFFLFGGNMEAMRIARGPLLALWLLPFLNHQGLRDFAWGAVLALLGIAAAVLIERISFTSLTDFTTDYRTTGSFWEMHVGGAALDGALVLTWPFAVWAAVRAHGALRIVGGAAALLGAYAVLAGFTRSTYAAAAVSLGVLAILSLYPRTREKRERSIRWPVAILIVAVVVGCAYAFDTSGYRGLAALLGVGVCAWLAAGARERDAPAPRSLIVLGLAVGGLLAGMATFIGAAWPKAVYAQVPAALLLAIACGLSSERRSPLAIVGAFAALAWSAIAALRVAIHWGGESAAFPAGAAASLVMLVALLPVLDGRTPWRVKRRHLMPLCLVLGCIGMTIAVANSNYAQTRFSTVSGDLMTRIDNWRRVLALVVDAPTALIGRGTGQFPFAYRWQILDALYSGEVQLRSASTGNYASLDAPRHPQGDEEVFRLTQRIGANDITLPAHLELRARANEPARVGVELCRKHLIYPGSCVSGYLAVPGDGQWHALEWWARADADLSAGPWYAVRPLTFAISPQGTVAFDVTDLSLTDVSGAQLLDNGDFSFNGWRWFSASDRQHLPWHAKNMFLHLLVENGILGALAVALAFVVAMVRLTTGPARTHPFAAPLVASLAGFLVAGSFDSIIDAPRVAFMLFVWLGIGLGLPAGRISAAHPTTPVSSRVAAH